MHRLLANKPILHLGSKANTANNNSAASDIGLRYARLPNYRCTNYLNHEAMQVNTNNIINM